LSAHAVYVKDHSTEAATMTRVLSNFILDSP
jgi:hypothetical protein